MYPKKDPKKVTTNIFLVLCNTIQYQSFVCVSINLLQIPQARLTSGLTSSRLDNTYLYWEVPEIEALKNRGHTCCESDKLYRVRVRVLLFSFLLL